MAFFSVVTYFGNLKLNDITTFCRAKHAKLAKASPNPSNSSDSFWAYVALFARDTNPTFVSSEKFQLSLATLANGPYLLFEHKWSRALLANPRTK
jgi:hypothetical protein